MISVHICAMSDMKILQSQPQLADRRHRFDSNGCPTGLHDWRGHTREGIAWEIHKGDAEKVLKDFQPDAFDCVVTSPPYYWQRDYGVVGQIGQEKMIDGFVKSVADTMEQVRRVLTPAGLLFLNLGDTYYSAKGQPKGTDKKSAARRFGLRAVDASGLGVPRKTIIGIPWRVALEMIARGWILRSPIIWTRTGAIPEPTAKDRPWRTYEMIFMFSKSPRYYFSRSALNSDEDDQGLPTSGQREDCTQRLFQSSWSRNAST
jgi:hypothetical protein